LDVHVPTNLQHMLLTEIRETLTSDWSSFGVEIGKKGDVVTPLSQLRVKPFRAPIVVGTTTTDAI
jgi:hypothetical protein